MYYVAATVSVSMVSLLPLRSPPFVILSVSLSLTHLVFRYHFSLLVCLLDFPRPSYLSSSN